MVYREPQRVARFVCIVCYKTMSTHSAPCRRCGVDRLDLSDPEVREQVRLEAEKRLQRRMYREWSGLALTSAALLSPAFYLFSSAALFLVAPLTVVLTRAYATVRKDSAVATYASRRRRISDELGIDADVDDLGVTAQSTSDPLALEMEPLLKWLGAELED